MIHSGKLVTRITILGEIFENQAGFCAVLRKFYFGEDGEIDKDEELVDPYAIRDKFDELENILTHDGYEKESGDLITGETGSRLGRIRAFYKYIGATQTN